MLGKLMKYEFKSTGRVFLPFFIAIISLSIVNRIFFFVLETVKFLDIPRFLLMTLYVFMIIATFVLTLIVTIQRFYKNLLGDEGYLMFTLPVKTSSLILSKGIVAYIWILGCILTTLLSIFILLPDYTWIANIAEYFKNAVEGFRQVTGGSLVLLIVELSAMLLIGIAAFLLQVYTAIAIGQLSNKHKLGTAFGAYLAIYAIIQIINGTFVTLIMYFYSNKTFEFDTQLPMEVMNITLLTSIFLGFALCIAYFFITRHLLKNKLNLE